MNEIQYIITLYICQYNRCRLKMYFLFPTRGYVIQKLAIALR